MLESLKKRHGSLRWAPRQRFLATERGRAALAQYEEAIRGLHLRGGERQALEELQQGWGASFQVSPQDAAVLGEFGAAERLPREVLGALEGCGTSLQEVQAAIDRLFTAGLLAPAGGAGPLPPRERQAG